MSQAKTDFTLYYWGIDGRGHFVRILFLEKGVEYTEINDAQKISEMGHFKGTNKNKGFPCFAPPFLVHGDHVLSQTNTVVRYVATKLGLLPEKEIDQFHADQMMACVQDLATSFGEQTEKTKEERIKYLETRFQTWLEVFCSALGKNEYFFGGKLSYIDLEVFCLLSMLNRRLGAEQYKKFVAEKHAELEALRLRISKRECVQKLVNLKKGAYGESWKF